MKSYLDLEVTAVAMDLVAEVYELTKKLPASELYGLSKQLKNAASSIVANIAEGFGRYTFRDKANKYTIARGECTEVVAHLHIAVRVKLLQSQDIQRALALANQTGRMLSGLINSSRSRSSAIDKFESPVLQYSNPQYSKEKS